MRPTLVVALTLCAAASALAQVQVPLVELAEPDVVRGQMEKEIVRRVVHRHINELRFCYETELARHPDAHGTVVTNFVIGPDGTVTTSTLRHTSTRLRSLDDCVTGAFRRWEFPAPVDHAIVEVTQACTFRMPPPIRSHHGMGAR